MRTLFTKIFIYFFLTFFCQSLYAQTVLTINSCDTVITNPSPGIPNGSCTVTIKSTTPGSRLAYNVEYFNLNYSPLYIYNGPTTTSPLMTVLGDIVIPNQKFGGQTTGDAITFSYMAIGQANPPQHFKIRIRCVQTPQNYPTFQPLPSLNAGGSIATADYDKDGDLDLLIGGIIFRNDSYFDSSYLFERKTNLLSGWDKPTVTAADFDNDGFKDIFISGSTSVLGGLFRPMCAVYRNNGNGTFTLATTATTFEGAFRGGCSIIDFNNDGKPDICYTGATQYFSNTSRIFKIYLNNGTMNFTDANVALPGVTGLVGASMSWADSDGDGDKDLLINGHNGTNNVCNFYTVNGTSFTNQNLAMQPTSAADVRWADVNMDGKPDIVNMGVATPDNINAIVPEIFFNNGNNNFTQVLTNLPKLALGSYDLVDYDGDNDLDVVLDGVDFVSTNSEDAGVFKNIGNGQFTRVGINGAKGSARVKWLDFNNDGKMDIVGLNGYYIKNMGADSFKISSFTATWRQYGNAGTLIEDFNNDGYADQFVIGAMADVDCNNKNTSTLVLGRGWRNYGVPKFTEVANLYAINPPLSTQIQSFNWTWGDFDSDGNLDVLAANEPYNPYAYPQQALRMFKNNGANNFSLAFNSDVTPLPALDGCYKQVLLVDIDKDGINELFAPCYNTLYKRINGQWVTQYTDYTGNGNPTPGWATIGDYNNDGYPDIAVAYRGVNTSGGTPTPNIIFYKNNQAGKFVIDAANSGFYDSERQIAWADLDNDGDLDLIYGGGVLDNLNGSFKGIPNQISAPVNVAVADFNGDGFKDFVNIHENFLQGDVKIDYGQQGTFFFDEYQHGYQVNASNTPWNESAVSFDVDNDGDDDIVYSASLCNVGAAVLVNQGNFTNRLIHVVSPNGAENFNFPGNRNIKWYGYQIGSSVKIEISRDSGATWQIIDAVANSSSSGGSYSWGVTGPASAKCLVRITDNTNGSFTDKSDAVFSISPPSVAVANAGRDTILCKGQTLMIGTSSQPNSTYSWISSPVGFVSSSPNPVVNPVVSTTYYLTVTMGTLVAKDTVKVDVSAVNVSLPDSMKACIGKTYTIGVVAQNGFSYLWSSVPTGFASNVAMPWISPVQRTMYYLTMKDNQSGCTAIDSIKINADSCASRGNGIVFLYPNPTSDVLNIDGLLLSRNWQSLEIYDMQKRMVMPEIDIRRRNNATINVAGLLRGIYFLRIINLDGGMHVFKFVKR